MVLSWRVPLCFSLPHSVQTLEVHLETFLHNDLNDAIVGLLEASPTLKDLHVTYGPNIDTVPEGFFQSLPDFCVRRNIRPIDACHGLALYTLSIHVRLLL